MPSAATHVAGVIGHPVRHSLSPAIHNAAYRAMGLDWVFFAFDVPPDRAGEAVTGMRALGLAGLSVTMPHKATVIPALDRLTTAADALGAVNTIARVGDELVGDNTDGAGFLDTLRVDEGFDPAGSRCVVLGAGGAARAVVLALAGAGAREIVVVNRSPANSDIAVALAPGVARTGQTGEAATADLVVNATPVGMGGDERLPLDPGLLGPGQLVLDLVYHPPLTPLVAAARERGAVATNGLGMLIHQAAHAIRIWTGEDPPTEVMSAAALSALTRRD